MRVALALWLCGVASAQISFPTAAVPTPAPNADIYGRSTPRGTVVGFLQSAQSGNYQRAARNLELTRNQDGETIARELKYVLDNLLITNLDRISNSPQGALDDKLDPDQERIGAITVDSKKVDILLHQVPSDLDPAAKIWLFSAATLKQIPALDREVDRPEIEKYLPPIALVHTYILHLRLWQLVAFVLVIPVSFLISGLFTRLMKAVLRPLIQRITHEQAGQGIQTIGGPVKLIVWVLVLHTAAYSVLALPVLARQILIRIVSATSIAAAAWLLSRIIELTARLTQERMMRTQQQAKTAVVHLVRRLLKAVVGGLAILFILQSAGINLTAVVAGVSVVGIAVAFAAQKTLENLFGGMMIITDEPVRVGDVCRFGSELGTVEDIGIRSTRIRTMGRSVVAVPNGQFSAMSLENLSVRDKILFNPTIGLRGETSADQLRFVLAEIRRMLYGHPKVETATARVRFVKFGDSSLDVEVFAYVPTQDNLEFLAVREDLLLRIMDIVETGGSGLANPSQTVYLGKDSGLNAEKSRIAAEKVDQWRKQNALPFPDFGPGEIAEISNKIPYPDPESAQRED